MYAPDVSVEVGTEPPSSRTNDTGIGPGTATPFTSAFPETMMAVKRANVRFVAEGAFAVAMKTYRVDPIVSLPTTA